MRPSALFAFLVALLPLTVYASDKVISSAGHIVEEKTTNTPRNAVTRHKATFGGVAVDYRATAGETYLRDKTGKPLASIFSISYVREGVSDLSERPVLFLFNGGPGSASMWLHMGAFGPKRVAVPDVQDDGAPPYPIVHNPHSLLDVADLVFIDPVGTGYSRTLNGVDPKDYWGVTSDAQSVAEFIRIWTAENQRWNSPKYLVGESYGTARSVAVAHELEARTGDVSLNGLIMVSAILDFALKAEVPGNEMQYVVNLPSMAAAAWHHGKVENKPPFDQFISEAREFAGTDYITALIKGVALDKDIYADIRRRVSYYSGLTEAYLDQTHLRVTPDRYLKELLRDRGLTIGRYDTRYTGVDHDTAGELVESDSSIYSIKSAYITAVNQHIAGTLQYKETGRYVVSGEVSSWEWDISGGRPTYKSFVPLIGRIMRENTDMRIFLGQGWFDFSTAFYGAEFALTRVGIPQDRIEYQYYDAGHMMYTRYADLEKLSADIRQFVRNK